MRRYRPGVLRWEPQVFDLSLAFDETGRQVGRVRRWRNGWEAHYDPNGLERPPIGLTGGPADEGHRLGHWASAGEACRAVERHHDRRRA